MTDAATRLAREVTDLLRRVNALERSRQLGHSSIDVDGETVTVADGVAAGFGAGATANEAKQQSSVALQTADGKNTVIYGEGNPTTLGLAGKATNDLYYDGLDGFRPYRWSGTAWLSSRFASGAISSLTAARITTGTLAAGVSITAGNPAGDYTRLTGEDILAMDSDGRSVKLTHTMSYQTPTGNTNAGAGLIFSTPTNNYRWSQVYSTASELRLDSPAYTSVTGSLEQGATVSVSASGVFGYTEGYAPGSNMDSLQIRNDATMRLGIPELNRPIFQLLPDSWLVGPAAGTFSNRGVQMFGELDGTWNIRNLAGNDFPRIFGNPDSSFLFGTFDRRFYGNADGTWGAGHVSDQAIYSQGNDLRIRGRRAGGDIIVTTNDEGANASGTSWVDFWGLNGAGVLTDTAKVYVHGDFGASRGKSFIIDHPDPAKAPTLMLRHGCVEGPDEGVIYRGRAVTGPDGTAAVTLPDYVPHLIGSRELTVTTGVIGTPQPVGHEHTKPGAFTLLATPGTTVTWLAMAARGDIEVEPPRSNFNVPELTDDPADSARPKKDLRKVGRKLADEQTPESSEPPVPKQLPKPETK